MNTRYRTGLYLEQVLFLALLLLLLLACLGWELPGQARFELLRSGMTAADTDRLTQLVNPSWYRNDAVPPPSVPPGKREGSAAGNKQQQWFFSDAEYVAAFRSYINGSGAVDERKGFKALSLMDPANLDLDPKLYVYGGSYLYPMAAVFAFLQGTGVLQVTTDIAAYLDDPEDMALLYRTGRLLSVLAFAGALWLLGVIGNQMGGRLAGLAAMASFGLSTLTLNYAVVTKPHIYAAFFGLLAVWFLLRSTGDERNGSLVRAASAAGWAFGASFAAGALAVLFPFLLYRKEDKRWSFYATAAAWAGMGIVFLLTNPYALLSWSRFSQTLRMHAGADGYQYGVADSHKLLSYLRQVIETGYCFPASLFGIVGLGCALWLERGWIRRLALAAGALLILIGLTLSSLRISIFAGALFCLYIGGGLARCLNAAAARGGLRYVLAVIVFLPPLFFAGQFFGDTLFDQRWRRPARAWIERADLRTGAAVGVFAGPSPVHMPPFPFWRLRLIHLDAFSGTEEPPDYVMIGNYADEGARWEKHALRPRYALEADLGCRPQQERGLRWRMRSQSRICARVYRRS